MAQYMHLTLFAPVFGTIISSIRKCTEYNYALISNLIKMKFKTRNDWFPRHIFHICCLLHIRKKYHVNWKTYVELVPHVLSTSNKTCPIPYVFSIRFIQSEIKSWRFIAFADSTGAWECTKSCMLSICYYCKRINKLCIITCNNE